MVATVGRAANQNIRNFATKTDIAILKSDIAVIKSDVDLLKSDVGVLKSDCGVVKSGIAIPRSDIEGRIMRMTLYLVMAMVGATGARTAFLALFLGDGG